MWFTAFVVIELPSGLTIFIPATKRRELFVFQVGTLPSEVAILVPTKEGPETFSSHPGLSEFPPSIFVTLPMIAVFVLPFAFRCRCDASSWKFVGLPKTFAYRVTQNAIGLKS